MISFPDERKLFSFFRYQKEEFIFVTFETRLIFMNASKDLFI